MSCAFSKSPLNSLNSTLLAEMKQEASVLYVRDHRGYLVLPQGWATEMNSLSGC